MHVIYEQWPDYFAKALELKALPDHDPDYYKSIVLCGMGASATSCDILNTLIHTFGNVSSIVLRAGDLPSFLNKHTLVIANSVSGNTQETISMAQAAEKKNAEIICISSGGKLNEFAVKGGHKHVAIPTLSVPRASLPYLIIPGLRMINPFLQRSLESEISLIPANLAKIANKVSVREPQESNIAKKIASFLEFGFAFCFTSPLLDSVGTRFKNSLNENAKMHCLRETVLEASHNEIVPFTYNNGLNAKVLLLKWAGDSPIVKERFNKISRLFAEIDQPLMEVDSFEKSLINAIVSSIYILDYATIYMAVSRKVDPSPTPAIDILKGIRLPHGGR